MTKRKRAKMGRDSHTEIPITRIQEIVETTGLDSFRVKLRRRTDSGRLANMKTIVTTVTELYEIDDHVQRFAGGGKYYIEVWHPTDKTKKFLDFEILIDGPPKNLSPAVSTLVQSEQAERRALFTVPTPTDEETPAWAMPSQRYADRPVATHTSDDIAMRTVEDERVRVRKLEEMTEQLRKDLAEERAIASARLEAARADRDRSEREAEKARHEAELKRLEERLDAAASKKLSLVEMLPMAVPFVPVLISLIETRKSSAALEASRSDNLIKAQMEGVNQLMQATMAGNKAGASGTSDLLKVILPAALPLVTAWLSANSPKAQAELLATQSDAQMQQLGLVIQLIEQAYSGDPGNPYIELAQSVVSQLVGVAQQIAKSQNKPSPVAMAGQQAIQQLTAALVPGQAPNQQIPAGQQAPQPAQGALTPGEQIANQLFAHPACPKEMQTDEWFTIVAMLHDRDDADTTAQALATHIGNLDKLGTTPSFLEPVWDEPEKTLTKMLSFLPIWQADAVYAKTVIAKVIEILEAADEDDDAEPVANAAAE